MLKRLEDAGLVRRERDPDDGRRVVVRLVPEGDAAGQTGSAFDSAGGAWEEVASGYDDEQLALILGYLCCTSAGTLREA